MSSEGNRFAGQVALVTGGASGIGKAIGYRLASEGARVVVVDIDGPTADKVATEWSSEGMDVVAVEADLREEDSVRSAVARAATPAGLDMVVNCAGVALHSQPGTIDISKFDQVLAVNVRGAFLVVSHALPHLAASHAARAIVNIASIMAWRTAPGTEAYTSSKGALISFTKTLATSLGPQGIRVNAVAPGYIDTPIWDQTIRELPDPVAHAETVTRMHPLGRRGQPADVAGAVAFLLSPDASFITGEIITVDGGVTLPLSTQ